MKLEKLYESINLRLQQMDFNSLWHGFRRYKFALYNENECFFDGAYIEKTGAFCANTSIRYHGEYIAIWCISGPMDLDVLASKLVHEMFHAYQYENGWNTFANEMEALVAYKYSAENLSVKKKENELLLSYLESGNRASFDEMLSLRRHRSHKFPYEYRYEACNEMVEGSATYIELKALELLHAEKAAQLYHNIRKTVLDASKYIPIRILCYNSGALLFMAKGTADIDTSAPLGESMIESTVPKEADYKDDEINTVLQNYWQETMQLIDTTVRNNDIVCEGAELLGVNVYNPRHYDGFVVSTYFCQVRLNGEETVLNGDFLIKMKDNFAVERIYRLCDEATLAE